MITWAAFGPVGCISMAITERQSGDAVPAAAAERIKAGTALLARCLPWSRNLGSNTWKQAAAISATAVIHLLKHSRTIRPGQLTQDPCLDS